MTSERCLDGTYWSRNHLCVPCETTFPILAGYEFSTNCGLRDDEQLVEAAYKQCGEGTFNDGSHVKCQTCSSCPNPLVIASACNNTSDNICCRQREQALNGTCVPKLLPTTEKTILSTTLSSTASIANSDPSSSPPVNTPNLTGIYVCLGILSALSLVCLFFVIKRRRRNHFNEEFQNCGNGAVRESLTKKGLKDFQKAVASNVIKKTDKKDQTTGPSHLLAPGVQNAPLSTVLNNLDVLQELVFVLDPDGAGVKNTRHLASQCSFSFAWINYAYSMKDHKSPLVAVLEGAVTKNPDWTVGDLAEMLSTIGRNDAIEILANLSVGVEE
ncbi:IGF-like family receptor 1 [Danio aesculapii]|uniref:IGF-like family receptor 1 n=1 Tax=Danio aesculapii TaxID=1142201 RepID=UPI0024C013BA|nr:IGF-like family receptor 1 [Danio aesculapii]